MKKEMRKVLVSGMIGNALEWYDFVLFVQCAPIIAKLFFPSSDPQASLLSVFGVFAAGFIMRPLGGVLFGYLGDKLGRKASLVFSILMMAIPTALIGLLPTYSEIGLLAPIMLTLMRLLQGLALGGGFSGCMTFLVEHAPSNQRGLIGSASMFSLGAGVLLGLVVTSVFSFMMGKEIFQEWGWRVPFVISLGIGTIAFYIKNNVNESPVYEQAKKHGKLSKTPIKSLIFSHTGSLLVAIGLYLTVTVPFYTFSAFFNSFMQHTVGFTLEHSILVNAIAMLVFMICMPIAGFASDIYGRKKILKYSAIAMFLISYPVFHLLLTANFTAVLMAQILFGAILGFFMGPTPAALVELFPTSVRFTGLSLSYNISAALFGGTSPYIYIYLIKKTKSNFIPAYYIMLFVIVTLFSLSYFKNRNNVPLEE